MGFHKICRTFLISIVLCLLLIPYSIWAQGEGPLTYENEAMGVKITGPAGWYVTSGEELGQAVSKTIEDLTDLKTIKEATKRLGFLIVFSKYPFGSPREFNPNISLVTEPIKREYIKTAVDYANGSLLSIKAMYKDVKVIKEPTPVTLNGREGANFIYEGTVVMGYLERRIKSSVYVFIKGDVGYNLGFADKADDFDSDVTAFESSAETFVLK